MNYEIMSSIMKLYQIHAISNFLILFPTKSVTFKKQLSKIIKN